MLKQCHFLSGVVYDDERPVVIIGNCVLNFGSCSNEYALLALLLAGREVTDDALALCIYRQEANDKTRALVAKSISRLRSRLKAHSISIARIHGNGYQLYLSNEE